MAHQREHGDSSAMTLVDYLRASKKALIFTGAGISTGSGIRIFAGRKVSGPDGSLSTIRIS